MSSYQFRLGDLVKPAHGTKSQWNPAYFNQFGMVMEESNNLGHITVWFFFNDQTVVGQYNGYYQIVNDE